jgi:hypothetical protein
VQQGSAAAVALIFLGSRCDRGLGLIAGPRSCRGAIGFDWDRVVDFLIQVGKELLDADG